MTEELNTILWALLGKFIKKSVLDEATTAAKLSKIDVLKKENILPPKKVDAGFACKILLQEGLKSGKSQGILLVLMSGNPAGSKLVRAKTKLQRFV